jgi:hypothetical protein
MAVTIVTLAIIGSAVPFKSTVVPAWKILPTFVQSHSHPTGVIGRLGLISS